MYGTFKRHIHEERAAAFAVGPRNAEAPAKQVTPFAATPHGKVRNATAGVQDWSVGDLFPCTVQAVGDAHEGVKYQGADLHDADAVFERYDTYAEAEAGVRRYLKHIQTHGRPRARMIRNLQRSAGGVTWAGVAA